MNERLVKDHDLEAVHLERELRCHVPGLDWHVLQSSEREQLAKRTDEHSPPQLMGLCIMYRWVKYDYKGRLMVDRIILDDARFPGWLMVWEQVRHALKAQDDIATDRERVYRGWAEADWRLAG